ncbi:MAG: M23 family metallopeptidase [Candidatus Cloacimonadales bacterium]|nr:M23 family metallopeptidase [Candidatus Cloacimonadales bacterium]
MKKYRTFDVPKTNLGTRASVISRYEVGSRYEVCLRNVILLTFLLLSISLSAVDLLTLKGFPSQGCLLIGEVDKIVESIFADGKEIKTINHRFLLGFDRDAVLRHTITLITTDGKVEKIVFYLNKYEYDIQNIEKIQQKYIEQPSDPKLKNKIYLESETLKVIRKQMKQNIFCYRDSIFIRPVEKGWISATFGGQRIVNGTPQTPHNGVDIALPLGTEIHAMTSGVVALTGDYFYNGKFVLLDHGAGLSSIYLHMNDIYVKKGDYVKTGDLIGEVGSTGRSTGNHLHWGVNWFEKQINPELVLKTDEVFLKFRRE